MKLFNHLIKLLLIAFAMSFIAACAVNDDDDDDPRPMRMMMDDPGTSDPFSVSALSVARLSATTVRLSWTNPDQDNITAFNITATYVDPDPDTDATYTFTPTNEDDLGPRAQVTHEVGGTDTTTLVPNGNYRFSVLVIYHPDSPNAGRGMAVGSAPVQVSPPDTTDGDEDGDGIPDSTDNCPAVANADQANNDMDTFDPNNPATGGDVCDTDDDNDGTADAMDAYPNDNTTTHYTISGLTVTEIAGERGNVAVTWTNPLLSTNPDGTTDSITAVIISHNHSARSDAYTLPNLEAGYLTSNATYSYNVTDLVAGTYNITVALDTGMKLSSPVTQEVTITTGAPDLDGDNLADAIDDDDDNDGTIDTADPLPRNASVAYYNIGNLTVTEIAGERGNVTVRWTNPVLYGADSISAVTISHQHMALTTATSAGTLAGMTYGASNTTYSFNITGVVNGINRITVALNTAPKLSRAEDTMITLTNGLVDTDGDGIADGADNCPVDFNPGQENTDGDATGDVCEDTDGDGVYDLVDACPQGETGWTSNRQTDSDGDGCRDSDEDVDDDGDGLIEISTPEELNNIRNDNWGRESSDATAAATQIRQANGCVSSRVDDSGLPPNCRGYELVANISLSGFANWDPIGDCSPRPGNVCNDLSADQFNATFDGNGHTISDLTIANADTSIAGVGLFGAASPHAEFRNLALVANSIETDVSNVGGLLGRGRGVTVTAVSVVVQSINGSDNVGGLVGDGSGAKIRASMAIIGNISAANTVGGLVGNAEDADIRFSAAALDTIDANNTVGGLVGDGNEVFINATYALAKQLIANATDAEVDGLIGNSNSATLTPFSQFPLANPNEEGLGVNQSYWLSSVIYPDSQPRGRTDNAAGESREEVTLNPTSFSGDYSEWGEARCNPDTGEFGRFLDGTDNVLPWDFTADEYPALNCVPLTLSQQRTLIMRTLNSQPLLPLPLRN